MPEKEKDFDTKKERKSRKGRSRYHNKRDNINSKEGKLCMNDPNWYVLKPELLRDAANLPYSHFLGKGFDLKFTNDHAIEAVMVKLPFIYTLGVTQSANDPVNLAIRNLYTYVRHQNSGHTNYESADLGLYLLATASVIATLAHLERCIGLAKFYQRRSSIMPRDVLSALGVGNISNFIANLANYTLRLNVLWSRVSSLCIPKDFSFLKRWVWMNSQIFKDHESDKAALYFFKPISVPRFDGASLNGGCIRQYTNENLTPTIDDWFNDAETALGLILADEDMNIMSGDILKAYGSENLLQFGMTPIDYVLEPVYVEEMLPQIQHAMTAASTHTPNGIASGTYATGISYDVANVINDQTDPIYTLAANPDEFIIYQVGGEVISQPCQRPAANTTAFIDTTSGALFWAYNYTTDSNAVHDSSRILTSYKIEVPPEDNMIATRLMYVSELDTRVSYSGGGKPLFITSCGSELITSFQLFIKRDNSPVLYTMDYDSDVSATENTASTLTYIIMAESVLNQMDWRPITYATLWTGSPVVQSINKAVYGDIDNFTFINPNTLKGMHLTALLAEFSVTQYNLIKG